MLNLSLDQEGGLMLVFCFALLGVGLYGALASAATFVNVATVGMVIWLVWFLSWAVKGGIPPGMVR